MTEDGKASFYNDWKTGKFTYSTVLFKKKAKHLKARQKEGKNDQN